MGVELGLEKVVPRLNLDDISTVQETRQQEVRKRIGGLQLTLRVDWCAHVLDE